MRWVQTDKYSCEVDSHDDAPRVLGDPALRNSETELQIIFGDANYGCRTGRFISSARTLEDDPRLQRTCRTGTRGGQDLIGIVSVTPITFPRWSPGGPNGIIDYDGDVSRIN